MCSYLYTTASLFPCSAIKLVLCIKACLVIGIVFLDLMVQRSIFIYYKNLYDLNTLLSYKMCMTWQWDIEDFLRSFLHSLKKVQKTKTQKNTEALHFVCFETQCQSHSLTCSTFPNDLTQLSPDLYTGFCPSEAALTVEGVPFYCPNCKGLRWSLGIIVSVAFCALSKARWEFICRENLFLLFPWLPVFSLAHHTHSSMGILLSVGSSRHPWHTTCFITH